METILVFSIPIALLALGLLAGTYAERRHIRNLDQREAATSGMLVTQIKTYPGNVPGDRPPGAIFAEAVIATDHFKTFLARLRNFFGGEVGSYQKMLTRARREAALRILEQARQEGYNAVCNIRLETADIGGNSATQGKKGMVMAATLASATAYHVESSGR